MGVKSDGSYGVDTGLYYSFPVVVSQRTYNIVGGLELDPDTTTHIAHTTRLLRAELDDALAIDEEMPPVSFDEPTSATAAAVNPCHTGHISP